MMKRWIWTCAAALALPGWVSTAGAYSLLDRAYGTQELGISARSRAMGGTGAALGQGVYSLVDNPAALSLMRGNRFQIDGYLARSSENRFVPVFDTFDSFVDETAIAVNDDGYASIQGGVAFDKWGPRGPVVAAGIFNRYDPRYDYFNEIRTADNSDIILGNHYIETGGVLRAFSLGASLPIEDVAHVGAAVNYYFGTFRNRNALVAEPQADFDTEITRSERSVDGVSLTLGGAAQIDERIGVGASIETAPNLDDDATSWVNDTVIEESSGSGDLKLPLRVQGGFTYKPRNTLRTTFAGDFVYVPWSDLEDHLNPDVALQDTWDIRFGLEHVFYNDLAGRIGFRFAEAYAMEEADRATFTFGFGYIVEQIQIDLAGEVGKRNSRQEPVLERDAGPRIGLGTDRIEDTLVRVFLGANYSFE